MSILRGDDLVVGAALGFPNLVVGTDLGIPVDKLVILTVVNGIYSFWRRWYLGINQVRC